MAELPRLFTRFFEVEGRDDFDPTVEMTLDDFGSIVGEYRFPEDEKCQVRRPEGICGHKHRHGWLGKTKDGVEVLVGSNCAVKYFNADKLFSAERSRVQREIRITNNYNLLTELLADKEAFLAQVDTVYSRLKFVRESLRAIQEELPSEAISQLRDMAKTGNRNVSIQVQYVEKDENGKESSTWIDQNIGTVSGALIWEYAAIGQVFKEIKEIKTVVGDVHLSRQAGDRKLKKWADILGGLPGISTRVDEAQAELDRFATSENLRQLVYLVTNNDDRLTCALLALKYDGTAIPTSAEGRQLVNQMDAEIRQVNAGRNFRIPR